MLTKFLNNVSDQEALRNDKPTSKFQERSGVDRVFDFTIARGNLLL